MLVMRFADVQWPLSLHSMFKAQYKCQVIIIVIIIILSTIITEINAYLLFTLAITPGYYLHHVEVVDQDPASGSQ